MAIVGKQQGDRREQIIETALAEFQRAGYHQVGIEQILGKLGLSGPALYHHFPNKYALLRDGLSAMHDRVEADLARVAVNPDDPRDELADLLTVLAQSSVENRAILTVGFWDSRSLEPDDLAAHAKRYWEIYDRATNLIATANPEWPAYAVTVATMLLLFSAYTFGYEVSPFVHPDNSLDILRRMSYAVVDCRLPEEASAQPIPGPAGLTPASKREILLRSGVRQMRVAGYHKVTLDGLAAAAGITTSGVYRYFDSKADLLELAVIRGNDVIGNSVYDVLATASSYEEAVPELARNFAHTALRHPDLVGISLSELRSLEPRAQDTVVRERRAFRDEWVAALTTAHPHLSLSEAQMVTRITAYGTAHVAAFATEALDVSSASTHAVFGELCAAMICANVTPAPSDAG